MRHKKRRGFTAAEKTELWDRWQRGESLNGIGRAFGKPSSSIYAHVSPRGLESATHLNHSQRTRIEVNKIRLELLCVGSAPVFRPGDLHPGVKIIGRGEVVAVPKAVFDFLWRCQFHTTHLRTVTPQKLLPASLRDHPPPTGILRDWKV
jgi:hypothetical protein